jgi:transposase
MRDLSCGDARIYLEVEVRRVFCRGCGKVKRERLDWLANNPFYTKRFAFYVGRKCRAMTVQDVARELHLAWHTVKALEKEYMEEQLRRTPVVAPGVIGIDEVSLRKGGKENTVGRHGHVEGLREVDKEACARSCDSL